MPKHLVRRQREADLCVEVSKSGAVRMVRNMTQATEPEPSHPRSWSAETINSAVQTLAILGAGAWAVYTFVYEAKIKPGLEPPSVSVTSSLERAGTRGDLVAIRSTVTRKNVGQTGVRVLALTYNVIGIRTDFAGRANSTSSAFGDANLARSSSVDVARDYVQGAGEVILRHGTLFQGATDQPSAPSELNPGEAVSRDLVFYVDRTRFDSVRFQVSLSYAKLSDPGLPLTFEVDHAGLIRAATGQTCRAEPERCRALTVTDFATEASLW